MAARRAMAQLPGYIDMTTVYGVAKKRLEQALRELAQHGEARRGEPVDRQ